MSGKQFTFDVELKKRGVERKLVLPTQLLQPDPVLIDTLAKATIWLEDLKAGLSITAIVQKHEHAESYVQSRLQLPFLLPKIQGAILEGRQPAELTAKAISRMKIPTDWKEQENLFGIV
ncbi:MAG: hypothetical protein AAF198_09170 [Pseudomonadota bacterium]